MSVINTIVFDLGGVLIDWNPEYLYRKIFDDEEKMKNFLENICNEQWNSQQDAGRSLAQATKILIEQYPDYTQEIQAYYGRWEETLGGAILDTVVILEKLFLAKKYHLYALTNWSSETFPAARKKFSFLNYFEGIIVSGEVKMKKPEPQIYLMLFNKYNIKPEKALFIDDSEKNINAAKNLGMLTIHFNNAHQLKKQLEKFKIFI